jgi:hypothetical protein
VDVHDKLDEITGLVENARSMPMSASCIVNRSELLGLLEELRELIPEEFRHAQLLLTDRDVVVDEGRREAARIVAEAEAERDRPRPCATRSTTTSTPSSPTSRSRWTRR